MPAMHQTNRDAAKGDYHLSADSPAIGAGVELEEVQTDFDGMPRPRKNGYSIGAFEHAGR